MYTVIEIQDNGDIAGVLNYSYKNEMEAHQKYYDIMRYAVSSNILYHSAAIFCDGIYIKGDMAYHEE